MKASGLFLLILILVSGCRQKDGFESRLYGRVVNAETGGNITGAEVTFEQQLVANGSFNANWQFVGYQETTSQGYDFTFERQNAASMRLDIRHDDYFDRIKNVNPDNVRTGEELSLEVALTAKSFLKVSVNNETPLNDQDELVFRLLGAEFSCACCDEEERTFIGQDIDTSWTCPLPGYQYLHYRFDVDKDTLEYITFDSIYIEPFDTSFLNISY